MKRYRFILPYLVTLILVILGALLPFGMGQMQDARDFDRITQQPIPTVRLEFADKPQSLSIPSKIALATFSSRHGITNREDEAVSTQQEMEKAAQDVLKKLETAGLILDAESMQPAYAACYLLYDPVQTEHHNRIWEIHLSAGSSAEDSEAFFVELDDETGLPLDFSYYNSKGILNGLTRQEVMEKLSELYWQLVQASAWEIPLPEPSTYADPSPNGSLQASYSFQDQNESRFQVEIHIDNYGFNITPLTFRK